MKLRGKPEAFLIKDFPLLLITERIEDVDFEFSSLVFGLAGLNLKKKGMNVSGE